MVPFEESVLMDKLSFVTAFIICFVVTSNPTILLELEESLAASGVVIALPFAPEARLGPGSIWSSLGERGPALENLLLLGSSSGSALTSGPRLPTLPADIA